MSGGRAPGRLVKVYKTRRKADLYLYVDHQADLERVPEELLGRFGEPLEVLSLHLTPDRMLARVAAADVLAAIEERGYFLQLPPQDGGVDALISQAGPAGTEE